MSTWIRFFSRTTTLWGEKGEEGRREEKGEERRREEKGEEGRREEKGEGRREEREDREGEKGRGEIEMCNGRWLFVGWGRARFPLPSNSGRL